MMTALMTERFGGALRGDLGVPDVVPGTWYPRDRDRLHLAVLTDHRHSETAGEPPASDHDVELPEGRSPGKAGMLAVIAPDIAVVPESGPASWTLRARSWLRLTSIDAVAWCHGNGAMVRDPRPPGG